MRKLGVLLMVVCGSVLLAGCGGDDSHSGAADHTMSFEGGVPAPAGAPGIRVQKAPAREQAPAPTAPDTGELAADRKEVVTGTVDLTADDPIATAQTLVDRVAELDGRVDQRTENPGTADSDPHANLIVRIPATDTDAFINGLRELGQITEVSTNRDDVTLQWQDLDARITALRASVDRLRDLMARAADTADLIAAEGALADRQGELDSLTGQRRYLDDQISLSTLTVDIRSTEAKTVADGPANFWDGIVDGWNSLLDWLKGAVVFVGQVLPWVVFLALLGAIVGAIAGLARRLRAPRGAGSPSGNKSAHADSPKTDSPKAEPAKTEAPKTEVESAKTTAESAKTTAEPAKTTAEPAKTADTPAKPTGESAPADDDSAGPVAGSDSPAADRD
ncbi:DUF4349 domain-containing protein [Nocardia sp. NPDC003963]